MIVGVNAVVADTDEEAAWLGTTMQQQFLNIIRGTTGLVQPPAEMEGKWTDREKAGVEQTLKASLLMVHQKPYVDSWNLSFGRHRQMSLIITSMIYDHKARLHSYELIAQLAGKA